MLLRLRQEFGAIAAAGPHSDNPAYLVFLHRALSLIMSRRHNTESSIRLSHLLML